MKFNISSEVLGILVIPCFKSENGDVVFFASEKKIDLKKKILDKLTIFNFNATQEEILFFEVELQKILLVGIKERYDFEDLRKAYSSVFSYLKKTKEFKASFELPFSKEEVISVIEGLDLTDYKFDKYISSDEVRGERRENDSVEDDKCFNLDIDEKFREVIDFTLSVNKEVKFVRDLVNENSFIMTPKRFEELAVDFANKNNLKIKVLDEELIDDEKLGLLQAVGQGSSNPARLILVEYNGDSISEDRLALVGKGVTFDTGGVNLKPTGYIEDMKTDMGGAATVFGVFRAAVELKLKKNLVLVLSCAENAISSSAYKPGDIFRSYSGKTVEVLNTDAEGRLVLADAISYVQKNYSVTSIIDMATLTGACLVALGPSLIASLGNNEKMKKEIFESGEKVFERVWNLPIYDEHRDLIKSKFADMKNMGGKFGGTITAAAFLEKFINDGINWVHLDIAGAARSRAGSFSHYIPEFGTGRGVRLLVNYLKK